jgi:arylsulfatase A-like enzyme
MFPALLTLMTLACDAPAPAPRTFEAAAPDTVILVIGCTLRADRLGSYGNPRETSPTLDQLAAEGARVERLVSNAPWTRPALAALTTGRYPLSLGIDDPKNGGFTNRGLHPDVDTLAEHFAAAGYATLGATANPNANTVFGLHQGFTTYQEATGLWRDDRRKVAGEDVVAAWAEEAAKVKGKLFGQLVLVDTHKPLAEARRQRLSLGLGAFFWPTDLDRYDAALLVFDAAIRSLDEALARMGRGGRLLFVVGDHGEGLYTPPKAGKAHGRYLYDANLQVPWIAHGPGVKPGAVIGGLTQSIDVGPTLLDLAGLPPSERMHGRSQGAALRGGLDAENPWLFAETYFGPEHKARLTTPEWTYLRNHRVPVTSPKGEELYRARDLLQGEDVSPREQATLSLFRAQAEGLQVRLTAEQQIWEVQGVSDEVKQQLQQLGYVEPE